MEIAVGATTRLPPTLMRRSREDCIKCAMKLVKEGYGSMGAAKSVGK
jgi:hypothetical protein